MQRRDLPSCISADNGPWPLHDAAASRQCEQRALVLAEPGALMARAGLAVARLALAVAPHAQRVQLACGPGNNGGDGLVASRHLHRWGKAVQVNLVADAARLPADAGAALHEAIAAGVPVRAGPGASNDGELIIDALLGIGTSRAPAGELAQAIASINAGGAPVLAVDIPSGLHPDTGAVLGAQAVRARWTLALLTIKPGCWTHQGRDHAGQIWFDALGQDGAQATAWLSGRAAAPPRQHASHKGTQGDVAVVGGATGMVGAAWLAAGAALAAGAGRVYCSLLADTAQAPPAARPELMTRTRWWLEPPRVLGSATVVCGCGGGDAVRAALPPLLAHAARLVLDADALNAIAADGSLRRVLEMRGARGLPTLLTPHPLEAARLLDISAAEVQADRLAAATSLAARCGATVLLKGSGSVLAAPGRTPVINSSGNAALASAGTGDVLAGWAAGTWAQAPAAAALDVATAAAWQHGRAADAFACRWPGRPLRAAALIEALLQAD